MYDTVEQVNMRLVNSVIMVDGQPVYVHGCSQDFSIERDVSCISIHYFRSDGSEGSCFVDSQDIDVRNLRLGYVNTRQHTYYLARTPGRQQSQGLTRRNTYTYVTGQDEPSANMFDEFRRHGSLYRMLSNEYPTIEQCAAKLNDYNSGVTSIAFHKHFALVRNDNFDFLELHFKNERIGYGDLNNFTLPSRYSYLTEKIQQSGVKIR